MEFLSDTIITEVSNALILPYRKNQITEMKNRPYYGLSVAFKGELVYICEGKEIRLTEKEVVFIPENLSYQVRCVKEGCFGNINFKTLFDINYNDFKTETVSNGDIIKDVLKKAAAAYEYDEVTKRCEILSLVYKFISLITEDLTADDCPEALNKAFEYIDKNISNVKLLNNDIAKYANISEVYLRKLFSKYTDFSVNEYIRDKRIKKAKRLLKETTKNISEISILCGFSEVYYFSRVFKTLTGISPTEYRNNRAYDLF